MSNTTNFFPHQPQQYRSSYQRVPPRGPPPMIPPSYAYSHRSTGTDSSTGRFHVSEIRGQPWSHAGASQNSLGAGTNLGSAVDDMCQRTMQSMVRVTCAFRAISVPANTMYILFTDNVISFRLMRVLGNRLHRGNIACLLTYCEEPASSFTSHRWVILELQPCKYQH